MEPFPEPSAKTKKTKKEEQILSAIGDYFRNHPQLREGKRSLSYADADEIIDLAVMKTGKPKNEIERLVRRVIKEYFEERSGQMASDAQNLQKS